MEFEAKRSAALLPTDVQAGNKSWWTTQTMSYDWKDKVAHPRLSEAWFDEIDVRFLDGARLIGREANPFEALMDVGSLAGRRVLEIGCGMGFHAQMLATAGADLTTIDLSETSIEATQERLALKKLPADIRLMDAEKLAIPDASFDLVWSWGVIHHSSRTGRIVREIERVLKPGGVAKIMVYNIAGASAYVTMMTRYSIDFWRHKPLDELMWESSDGFTARYYTRDLFADLLLTFFESADVSVVGQEADAIPLPRHLRALAKRFVSDARQRELAAARGSMLYAVARKAV